MSIFIKDVDAYQKIIKEAGADIVYGPVDEPHGMREMHVKDPDGNIIRFSMAIEVVTKPVRPARG
ncbi:MAG: VOC family protein [Hyphomicrobiaceae bacterium]|nr:VOC family protein [Hyphomicrobiaceae bacterium]